jgi:hypothetical protein
MLLTLDLRREDPSKKILFLPNEESKKLLASSHDELLKEGVLFVGLLDLRSDLPSGRSVLNKLLNEPARYKTEFWKPFKQDIDEEIQDQDDEIDSDYEQKIKTLDEIDAHINKDDQINFKSLFRPRSQCDIKFHNNMSLIIDQLFVKGVSQKTVSHCLRIPYENFQKLTLKYFLTKSTKINNFKNNQQIKIEREAIIAEILQSFIASKTGKCITRRM